MKNPHVCRRIMYGTVFIGAVLSVLSVLSLNTHFTYSLFVVGIGLAFCGIVFGSITVRCPHCKKELPLKGLPVSRCPGCGRPLS